MLITSVNNDRIKELVKLKDKKYRDDLPKKPLLETIEEEEIEEKLADTKEFDINAILEKAKSTQNVDYEKERLKKVHDTQYDILKNLNIGTMNIIYAGDKPNETGKENINENY